MHVHYIVCKGVSTYNDEMDPKAIQLGSNFDSPLEHQLLWNHLISLARKFTQMSRGCKKPVNVLISPGSFIPVYLIE